METRLPPVRALLAPALFGLACTILTLLTIHAFGGSLPLEASGYRVDVPVAEASNLVAGSDVQISGVKVGQVAAIQRSGGHAVVTLNLDPEFAPLRSGAQAIVRTKTLLGEGYIEIAPGRADAPPVPEGGTLPAANVHRRVQLDEFLSTFSGPTRRRLRSLLGGLAEAYAGRAGALSDSIARAAPFTADLGGVLRAADRQRASLRRLIASAGDVMRAAGSRAGELRAAIEAGNRLLSATASVDGSLAATLRRLPPFLAQLRATADRLAAASPDLETAVRALEPAAPLLAPALREIEVSAPTFRSLFRALPATLRSGDRGLPSLKPISKAARRGFHGFYPTSRDLIPFMQLFARDRNALKILANVAAVNAGSFVSGTGQVVGYATGIASIWNETISGWKKKLPTNRQNPYPKPPDGLLDTGRIGVLKSYDCRHVHNPLYLPPTGTGAPPCILQGPWRFDGRSAFYPRLYRAPP